MNLPLLRRKKRKRVKKRRRQWRLWKRTGKKGHLKAFRRHRKAVRKLKGLIRKATRKSTTPAGAAFIRTFEGVCHVPENDPVGYSTVGVGHLIAYRPVTPADHKMVWVKGQKQPGRLTNAEADRLLQQDLKRDYEPVVKKLFTDGPLKGKFAPHRFDALASFAFNLGVNSVIPGTRGFETMGRALTSGDLTAIGDAMLLYDKAGGRVLPGLVRRRRAERRLLLTGSYSTE